MEAQLLPKMLVEVVKIWTKVASLRTVLIQSKVGRNTYLTKDGSGCVIICLRRVIHMGKIISLPVDYKGAKIQFEPKGY